ncbi:hypothetical protein [Fulvitalea axinellae]
MFKFIGGPVIGTAMNLSFFEMWGATVAGMMTTVIVLSFFHSGIRKVLSKIPLGRKRRGKPLFTPNRRRFVKVWKLWGAPGVAFLTPVLFSPIIGTLVVVAFGVRPSRIMIYMGLSAAFWAMVICFSFGEIITFLG